MDLGCPLPAMSVTDWDEQMAGWSTEAGAEVSAESAEPGPLDVEADHWFLNDSSNEDDDSSEDDEKEYVAVRIDLVEGSRRRVLRQRGAGLSFRGS